MVEVGDTCGYSMPARDGGAMPGPEEEAKESRFALILGATSIVGRYLAARLGDRGFEGWCLSRRSGPGPYAAPPGFRWEVGGEGPIECVPPAGATLFSLVPITALPAILDRTPAVGQVVALSTSSARFKAESSDPEERQLARNVKQAEEEVRQICGERGIAWTVFRPTLVYDPGHDLNVTMIAKVARRLGAFPIVWPGTGGRQPIHADDVAMAMVAAMEVRGARNRLLDLPGGETMAYREMVRTVFRALGRRPVLVYMPLWPARLAFRVWQAVTGTPYSVASLERMNESLTLDPTPAREALGIAFRPFRPVFPEPVGREAATHNRPDVSSG